MTNKKTVHILEINYSNAVVSSISDDYNGSISVSNGKVDVSKCHEKHAMEVNL